MDFNVDTLRSSDGLERRELLRRGLISLAALGAGSVVLQGCGGSGNRARAGLPDVSWPEGSIGRAPNRAPVRPMPDAPGGGYTGEIIQRSEWARGRPIPARMERARPYWRITVHHDGMDTFTSTSRSAAAARLEQIRVAHLSRSPEPFGDIGYHYLIDPAGRVWAGRPLEWQGAHVAKTNEGNLGVCMLGNYVNQRPNPAQQEALDRFVLSQMNRYRVPLRNVYTHQELAPTACPGTNLQRYMVQTRSGGAMAMARA